VVVSGAKARDALLYLLGEQDAKLDVLVEFLVAAGVITEAAWDEAVTKLFADQDMTKHARSCLDPDDSAALDLFFTTPSATQA
jgi:hypothetical protein